MHVLFQDQWVTSGDGTQCETSVSGAGGGGKKVGDAPKGDQAGRGPPIRS